MLSTALNATGSVCELRSPSFEEMLEIAGLLRILCGMAMSPRPSVRTQRNSDQIWIDNGVSPISGKKIQQIVVDNENQFDGYVLTIPDKDMHPIWISIKKRVPR